MIDTRRLAEAGFPPLQIQELTAQFALPPPASNDGAALPPLAGKAGSSLTVRQDETGIEWVNLASLIPAPAPPSGWQLIRQLTITGTPAFVDLLDLGGFSDLRILLYKSALSIAATRNFQFSTDNGASFYTAVTDYSILNTNGTETVGSSVIGHATSNAAERSGYVEITGNIAGAQPKIVNTSMGPWLFRGSAAAINAVRVLPHLASTFLSGVITIWGRN